MTKICNVSRDDVVSGNHYDADVLIQIADCSFPDPKVKFEYVHQFAFCDIEYRSICQDLQITNDQILEIISLLKHYKKLDKNVLVHCHAGLSRSGAIVEIAVRNFGYIAIHNDRDPNRLIVKRFQEIIERQNEQN